MAGKTREVALFNLAIDGKLRACDLMNLMVRDVAQRSRVLRRAPTLKHTNNQSMRYYATE
jgi:hypothetical protein